MAGLRKRALFEKLNQHDCLRVSFAGLRDRYPLAFEIVVSSMKEFEMYEPLEYMINKAQLVDDYFAIFLIPGDGFILIENKDKYSKVEYEQISVKTGIEVKEFESLLHLN